MGCSVFICWYSLFECTEGESQLQNSFANLARHRQTRHVTPELGYEATTSGGAMLNPTITKIEAHLPIPRVPRKFASTLATYVEPASQST
ncbi:hypothetical protein Tco_0805889 [Tanacetum coccineum]